jgi:hypothetical protein
LKLGADYVDRDKTIQCDAEDGCLEWPHWECEGLTKPQIDRIDKYICKGCRDHGLGETTCYLDAIIPQDDDETDDDIDDEDVDEYVTESDVSNGSDGSNSPSKDAKSSSNDSESYSNNTDSTESESDDSDDYEQPAFSGHEREAASQPAPRGHFQLTD